MADIKGLVAKVANDSAASPKDLIFQDTNAPKEKKEEEEAEKEIIPKEFFWDQLVTYIATAIALLTLVDTTVQFFRSTGGLLCYIPEEFIRGETRDQAAYVNNFCQESLSTSEYYSIFILIQGIVIVAPHYLWSSAFSGQFDFFFDLVRQIDRLRDSKTGEYRTKNFEILKKLENEFPERRKLIGMFILYILKLAVQFVLIALSLVVNIAVFPGEHFQFVFDCPASLPDDDTTGNNSQQYRGWNLPGQVQCIYSSYRILSRVQYVDYLLLLLALGAVGYGLFWCLKRHTSGLGYKRIATFAFTSCLPSAEFVPCRSFFLPPRVRSDLDFLLMRLFRADPGHGRVFKDLQVDKEQKRLVSEDHELLHLTSSIIQDRNDTVAKSNYTDQDTEAAKKYRMEDIKDFYTKADFGENPDYLVYARMGELGHLGDMEVMQGEQVQSIRNQFYYFLRFTSKKYVLAYDISFGTIGFALILARAFKKVISVNFHPFYWNEKEVCRKEVFQANYCRLIVPSDIFSQSTPNINKFDEALDEEFKKPQRALNENAFRPANLIVVGPFTGEAKKATVSLHLERLYTGAFLERDTNLLAIRPLQIGFKDVSSHFCQYKPAGNLFEFVNLEEKGKDSITWMEVGEYKGIEVVCGKTPCIFEFQMYSFIGLIEPEPPLPPSDRSEETPNNSATSSHGNISDGSTPQANIAQINSSRTTARQELSNGRNSSKSNANNEIAASNEPDSSGGSQQQGSTGVASSNQQQPRSVTLQQISSSSLGLPSPHQSSNQSLQRRPDRHSQQTSVSVYSVDTVGDSNTGATSQEHALDSECPSIPPITSNGQQRVTTDGGHQGQSRPSSQMIPSEGQVHNLSLRSLQNLRAPNTEPLKRKTTYKFDLQPLNDQQRAGSKRSWQFHKDHRSHSGLPPSLSLPSVANGGSAPPPGVREDGDADFKSPSSSIVGPKTLQERV